MKGTFEGIHDENARPAAETHVRHSEFKSTSSHSVHATVQNTDEHP